MKSLLEVGTLVDPLNKENHDFAIYSMLICYTILFIWLLIFLLTDNKKNKKVGK